MPMNYLLIVALEKYYQYFEKELQVELPSHSGNTTDLKTVTEELRKRLAGIFTKDNEEKRKVNGQINLFNNDTFFKDLVLFYECFHGDNGKGIGASHQTGWTGIIAEIIRCRDKK
jgi:hypothetical protein